MTKTAVRPFRSRNGQGHGGAASPRAKREKGAITADQLTMLLFTPTPRVQTWTLASGEQTAEYGRPARFSSNNYGAVRDVAVAGGGIALLAEFMVADDLRTGKLKRVLSAWGTPNVDVHAVYVARANLPPRLARFLEHLVRSLDPPPWQ